MRCTLSVGHLVFESTGGMAREAEKVLKCINRHVAVNTNTPSGEVARRLWKRLSVDLQRAGHRAFSRRLVGAAGPVTGGMSSVLRRIEGLQHPGA